MGTRMLSRLYRKLYLGLVSDLKNYEYFLHFEKFSDFLSRIQPASGSAFNKFDGSGYDQCGSTSLVWEVRYRWYFPSINLIKWPPEAFTEKSIKEKQEKQSMCKNLAFASDIEAASPIFNVLNLFGSQDTKNGLLIK